MSDIFSGPKREKGGVNPPEPTKRPKPPMGSQRPMTNHARKAAEQIIWNHDVHATLLHLLGMDHKRLTYYFNGRNMRLTDVHGELIPQIA